MRAGHTPARLAPAGRPRPPGPCGSISAPRPGQTVLSCHFPSPNSAAACQIPSLFPNSFLTGLPRPLAGLAASTLEGLPVLVHSSASLTPLPGYAPGLVFGLGSSIPTLRLAPPGLSLPRAERTRRPGLTHTSPGTPQLPASVHPHTLRLPGAPSLPLPLDASHRHRPFLPSVPCGASAPSPLPAPGPREPRPSPLRASGTSVSPSLQPAPLLRLPRQPQRPGPPPAPFPLHPQGPRTPSVPTPAAPAPPPARPGLAQSRSQAPPSVPAPVPDAAASRDRRSGPRSRAARSSPRECRRRRDRDFRELRARGAGNAGAGGAGAGARGAAASLEKGTVRKHARRDEGSAVPELGGSQGPSPCRPGVREESTGVGCTAPALPPPPKGTVRVPRHT